MAVYRDPGAAARVLGMNSPEAAQMASNQMAPPAAPGGAAPGGAAPGGAVPGGAAPGGMDPTAPLDSVPDLNRSIPGIEEGARERLLRSLDRERKAESGRSGFLLRFGQEPMPHDPNITFGEYILGIERKHGKDAANAAIDKAIKDQERKEMEEEGPKGMPIIPNLPQVPLNQELQAAVPPGVPVGEQGGIMAAATGGLVGFANGGINELGQRLPWGTEKRYKFSVSGPHDYQNLTADEIRKVGERVPSYRLAEGATEVYSDAMGGTVNLSPDAPNFYNVAMGPGDTRRVRAADVRKLASPSRGNPNTYSDAYGNVIDLSFEKDSILPIQDPKFLSGDWRKDARTQFGFLEDPHIWKDPSPEPGDPPTVTMPDSSWVPPEVGWQYTLDQGENPTWITPPYDPSAAWVGETAALPPQQRFNLPRDFPTDTPQAIMRARAAGIRDPGLNYPTETIDAEAGGGTWYTEGPYVNLPVHLARQKSAAVGDYATEGEGGPSLWLQQALAQAATEAPGAPGAPGVPGAPGIVDVPGVIPPPNDPNAAVDSSGMIFYPDAFTLNQQLDPTIIEGISGYQEGGIVSALSGSGQESIDEGDFMGALSELSREAGISGEDMNMVANAATEATGGSGAPGAANENLLDSGIMQNVEAVEAEAGDLAGIGSLADISGKLVEAGEEGLVHASPGEIVFDPGILPESQRNMLFAALQAGGVDPAALTVGDPSNVINETTGLPAFFLGKLFKGIGKGIKKVGKFLKKNAGTILGIAGAMTGNPWLAALGSGIGSLIEGKPIGKALLSAGMSFAGTEWVGPFIGEQLSGIAPTTFGKSLGETLGGIPGVGQSVAQRGAEGAITEAAQQAGMRAGAAAAIQGASRNSVFSATEAAMRQSLSEAASSGMTAGPQFFGAAPSLLGEKAIRESSKSIASKIISDVGSGALTQAAAATLPSGIGLTNVIAGGPIGSQLLGRSLGNTIGSAVAGAAQAYAQPAVEMSLFGDPAAKQRALDAWNEMYDYEPDSEQVLFDFYTRNFAPNRQVNPELINTLPGYNQQMQQTQLQAALPNLFGAAGGGYINGVGGPKSDSNLARLSDGEFVMTEAAVRGAGHGDRMAGAKRMYDLMNGLERRVA